MAADQAAGGQSFGRRLEKWVRDSAEVRALVQAVRGTPATPEEAALRRYHRSRTPLVDVPHPSASSQRFAALCRRHRELSSQMTWAFLSVPVLLVASLVVGPVAAQVALWGLVVPAAALAFQRAQARARIDRERHLQLRGGLADAWADWVRARDVVERIDGAVQARAALGVNEARMQALVLGLGRAEAHPDHRDTDEHRASREWVYRTAAQAVALAQAELELEHTTRLQLDASELRVAPDGDPEALEQALDAAREITRRMREEHP